MNGFPAIWEFGNLVCATNPEHKRLVESIPPGNEYCQDCALEAYNSNPKCPICGTPGGFAFGTGDCGCTE